jgi:uncharacterized iron-regulated membrane protein
MRAALTLIHRYVGLALAGFLMLAGLTGSVIAFHDELDAWLNPELYRVAHARGPLPVDTLIERVESAEPGVLVQALSLQREPGRSVLVRVEPGPDPAGGAPTALAFDELFVDPSDGRILGRRLWGECCLQRERAIPFLYSLHYSLHIPERAGVIAMGIVALVWVVDCCVALALTFPRGGSFWRRWRRAWQIDAGASRYRFWHDVHQSFGLWAWLVLLTLAISGVALNLREEIFRPLVGWFSELSPTAIEQAAARSAQARDRRIGFGAAIDSARRIAAERGWPALPSYAFRIGEQGAYGIGLVREGEDPEAGLGASWLYLSDHDGRLLATELAGEGSAGDVFVQAQFPLHSGKLLGMPGRVLISASGIVVAVLSGTGVYVWAVKRSARRAAAGSRTAASALEADPG